MPFANLLTGGGGNLTRILLLAGPGQPSFADTHGASPSSTIQQASLFAFAMSDGMQASFDTSLRTHGALGERFSFQIEATFKRPQSTLPSPSVSTFHPSPYDD